MKKIIAVILALTLSITLLASCKKPDGGNFDPKLPKITVTEEVQEFKNAAGKVAYQVEYTLPELDSEICSEYSAAFVNNYIKEFYLNPVFNFAEINVEHFREDETEPRKIALTHEIKYRSENVLSIVFTTTYSKSSSVIEARTFNLKDGSIVSFDWLTLGNMAESQHILFSAIRDHAKFNFTSAPLTDEQLAKFEPAFNPISFYFTNDGINFVYNKGAIIEGLGGSSGVYEYFVDWSSAHTFNLISAPDEMFAEPTTAA